MLDYPKIYKTVEQRLKDFCKKHSKVLHGDHGLQHFKDVEGFAKKALDLTDLSKEQCLQVQLACLLHDVDDRKFFESKDYDNAREMLKGYSKDFVEPIIQMVSLVSFSSNMNSESESIESWKYIPRDCDRLTAIGQIGIDRCIAFSARKGIPFHTKSTPICRTPEEYRSLLTPERAQLYCQKGYSDSVIDHCYDKLGRLGDEENLKSRNSFIIEEAKERAKEVEKYVLQYWKNLGYKR